MLSGLGGDNKYEKSFMVFDHEADQIDGIFVGAGRVAPLDLACLSSFLAFPQTASSTNVSSFVFVFSTIVQLLSRHRAGSGPKQAA